MGEKMSSDSYLNDDAFARLVAEEVKNKVSRTQKRILLLPENWDKWKRALTALLETLDEQLTNLASWESQDRERYGNLGTDGAVLLAQAVAEYQARRTKIERFRFHVERRLDDVIQMIQSGDAMEDEVGAHAQLFENAIKKHKQLLEKYDIEPNAVDLALWDALDGRWSFNTIRPSDVMSD